MDFPGRYIGGIAVLRLLLCLPLCLLMAPSQPETTLTCRTMEGGADSVTDNADALPTAAQLEKLARANPIAFLEAGLRRYQRTVKGYSCTFQKQERLDGKLQRTEVIEVYFREQPFSVYFGWLEGARLAERTLYVEGENDGMMLARPAAKLARMVVGDVTSRDPE